MSNPFNFPNKVYHATLLLHLDSIRERIRIHREGALINLDFGKGFYTTTSYQQALERAELLQEKERHANGVLSKRHRGIIITFELNSSLLYTLDNDKYKIFPEKNKEWAEYIVFNRVIRKPKHEHRYIWTYGSLADGKYIWLLCNQYFKREIDPDKLINGYADGNDTIRGIAPFSDDYDQLSFHEDEDFVNKVLKYESFNIIEQNLAQKRW